MKPSPKKNEAPEVIEVTPHILEPGQSGGFAPVESIGAKPYSGAKMPSAGSNPVDKAFKTSAAGRAQSKQPFAPKQQAPSQQRPVEPMPQGAPYIPPMHTSPMPPVQQGPSAQADAGKQELPVIQLNQDPQNPLQPRNAAATHRQGGHSKLLTFGIVSCIIGILVLIGSLLFVEFKPFGLFEDSFTVDAPNTTQVKHAFENAELPEPDLHNFNYVDASDLNRTSIDDFMSETVQYASENGKRQAYCEAEATAIYENSSVRVLQPLVMTMSYDRNDNQWNGETIKSGSIHATPIAAPDTTLIVEGFPEVLSRYDAQLASMYMGANITQTSSLTSEGGTMVFTLTKTDSENVTKTCTANADVRWSDTDGWNVSITSVDGDIAASSAPPAGQTTNTTPASPTTSNGTGTTTKLELECYSGELVEVPGTIQFDSYGHILLKTDNTIDVIFNGTSYMTDYFEIIGDGSLTNGQHVVIIGAISLTGSLPQAPLVINAKF